VEGGRDEEEEDEDSGLDERVGEGRIFSNQRERRGLRRDKLKLKREDIEDAVAFDRPERLLDALLGRELRLDECFLAFMARVSSLHLECSCGILSV
jgi:hypothetical protein